MLSGIPCCPGSAVGGHVVASYKCGTTSLLAVAVTGASGQVKLTLQLLKTVASLSQSSLTGSLNGGNPSVSSPDNPSLPWLKYCH